MSRLRLQAEPALDPRPALWAAFLCLLTLTLIAYTTSWDHDIAAFYWNQGQDPWPGRHDLFFSLLYNWGQLPAQLAGAFGLLGFLLSYRSEQYRRWRGPGLFLFLLLALGPGLVVNVLGKSLTGRPRPSQSTGFGGNWDYRFPWQFGTPGRGESFPSGHASMGFYWLCLFFLWPKRARWFGLAVGLVCGGWMCAARTSQGGHYLSDTLFSGAAVFGVAALLSPLIHWQPNPRFWAKRPVLWALGGVLLGVLMLAHIVYEERDLVWSPQPLSAPLATQRVQTWQGNAPLDKVALDLSLQRGDATVMFVGRVDGSLLPLRVSERFQGQGFPAAKDQLDVSALGADPFFVQDPGTLGAKVFQTLKGAWWTAKGQYDVTLPQGLAVDARLKTAQGVLTIGSFPQGRQVLLSGDLRQEALPPGFKPYGQSAWLLEGEQPQIALNLEAPTIRFIP